MKAALRWSGCRNGDMLVLDVGANSGYFSMISAALGCRVYAFELQAGCIELLKALVHANGFTNQVAVIHGAVGALGEYAIAPAVGCAGDAFARDKGRGGAKDAAVPAVDPQSELSYNDILKRIALVKVDAEDWRRVLRRLGRLLNYAQVVLAELTPPYWTRANSTRRSVATTLASLLSRFGFAACLSSDGSWMRSAVAAQKYVFELRTGYFAQRDVACARSEEALRVAADDPS